jgi:hypothetical protein
MISSAEVSVAYRTIQEECSSLRVAGDALQERKSVAYSVRSSSCELRRVEKRINRNDLL